MERRIVVWIQCLLVILSCFQVDSSSYNVIRWDEQRQDLEEDDSQGDYWSFVQTKGTQFVVNGLPFYINGFNTYWLMLLAVDPSTKPKISEVFQQAASVGLTVGRTWAFNDGGWRALQKSPGVYDEDVFKALDFVISEAKKNKIRLILSLSNNWEGFGGKSQYVKWGVSAGLKLNSEDAFFSHATLKTYFKDHIKEWIQEMAVYVKSIDRNHLLEIGSEGFFGPSSPDRDGFNPSTYATQVGTDFIRNHQTLGIDFASVHIYPDSWISQAISPSHLTFVDTWIKAHIQDCDKILNMPVLFTEFGISSRDPGYNTTYGETFLHTVYDNIISSAKNGGAGAGSLIWQLFPDGVEYLADGYEVVLSKSPSTAKIIQGQSVSLRGLSSVCKWSTKWSCRRDIITSPAFLSLTADLLAGAKVADEL